MTENQMTDPKEIAAFMLAGKATFTVTSRKSGRHMTFKVNGFEGSRGDTLHFVRVLVGSYYEKLGTIFGGLNYRISDKSPIGPEATSHKTIQWLVRNVLQNGQLPDNVIFQHSGQCGRCARPLTDPDSINRGLGPECARLVA